MTPARLTRAFCVTVCLSIPFFAAPAPAADEPGTDKVISGDGEAFSWIILDELKPNLERKYHRIIKLAGREAMLGAGCGKGIKKARENRPGHETFGFICCPLTREEIDKEGLTVHPLAQEALMILVNKSNPVDDIPIEKVRAIFRGEIRNWKEVGGEDRPIVVVLRPHCPDRPGHWKTIVPALEQFRKDRLDVKSEAEVVQRVSDFREGIGNIGATFIFSPDEKVKVVKVSGLAPTAENLRSGKYPFTQDLSIVTHGEISGDLASIIKDVQTSQEFKQVANKYQLVPRN
ncbi:MAG: substrate-binding domain-containing protein [Bacteroidota bacterium]